MTRDNPSCDNIPDRLYEQILERDGHSCKFCGREGKEIGGDAKLEIHHRTRRENGGTNDPDNLVTICQRCHRHHHRRKTEADLKTDLETALEGDQSMSPCDYDIVAALEQSGSATTGEIANAANISPQHCRRRLWDLMARGIVDRWYDSERWGVKSQVQNSARGRWPRKSRRAALLARDEMLRRLRDERGDSNEELADLVNVHPRTIPTALNRARALKPPLNIDESEETSKTADSGEETMARTEVEATAQQSPTDQTGNPGGDTDIEQVLATIEEQITEIRQHFSED